MILAGIDPGLGGAVALLDAGSGAVLDVLDMPTLMLRRGGKHKREIDAHALAAALGRDRIGHAFVEAVGAMPAQGVSSTFSFGKSYGVVIGVLATLGTPMTFVAPGVWKRRWACPLRRMAPGRGHRSS